MSPKGFRDRHLQLLHTLVISSSSSAVTLCKRSDVDFTFDGCGSVVALAFRFMWSCYSAEDGGVAHSDEGGAIGGGRLRGDAESQVTELIPAAAVGAEEGLRVD